MPWVAQESQAFGGFLQGHVPFDVALGIVVTMLILSFVFSLVNRPEKALAPLKSTLENLSDEAPDQVKLLWEYALHSDNLFNERQNFFLFFESILLGGTFAVIAATVIQQSSNTVKLVLLLIAFAGLLITVSWWYLQLRQVYILDCMTQFHKIVTPIYRDVISPIRSKPYRVGTNLILVKVFPLLVALLWCSILLYV